MIKAMELSVGYTVIFLFSFLSWLIFELWVFSRNRKRVKDASRDRGNSLWVVVLLIVGITVGFNLPGIAPQFNFQKYLAIFFSLGIALIWLGIAFRYWAVQTLGKFFSIKLIIQEKHQLITTGPYLYIRHPSYTAALITLAGFGFAIGNWLSVIALLVFGLIIYSTRIKTEEKMLSQEFGKSYEDYRKKTWRLIPFLL